MKKKIIYILVALIIIAGAIVTGIMGIKTDIIYDKNVRIDIYLGTNFENKDILEITKEVFKTKRVLVSQVEYYNDMVSIIISQNDAENIDEKIKELNTKINEKYSIENKVEDIAVTYQPEIEITSLFSPYILPITITTITVAIYAMIRYRKLGAFKTILCYILGAIISEAVYFSILAICRIPISRIIVPIGLAIYIAVLTILTIQKEKQLTNYQEEKNKK